MHVPLSEMPRGLVMKLDRYQLFEYRHTSSTEHIFSVTRLLNAVTKDMVDETVRIMFTREHKQAIIDLSIIARDQKVEYICFIKDKEV